MNLGLKGKIALVMASSKGLGFHCAKALAEEQCNVAVCSRSESNVKRAIQEIRMVSKSKIIGISSDLGTEEGINFLYSSIKEELGLPDILITNIGGPPQRSFEEAHLCLYEKWLNIGIVRVIQIIKSCIPAMKNKKWGRILAITSMSVKQPVQNLILSNVFRSGLVSFLKTISVDVAPFGITVNSLLPGMHTTDRLVSLYGEKTYLLKDLALTVPTLKLGDPSDFGSIAAFLVSKYSNFINGQNILIDGGQCKGIF